MEKIQITIRIPALMLNEFDRHCNGVTFHNRSHGFTVMLQQWLDQISKGEKGTQLNVFEMPGPRKGKKRK